MSIDRFAFLVLISSLFGCNEVTKIDCGGQCYTGLPNTANIGACQRGEYVCTSSGGECLGEILPNVETCNGVDDDCDGTVDNDPILPEESPCFDNVGECWSNFKASCVNGSWVCPLLPKEETCNFKDDNCDGEIDNIQSVLCYTHPNIELTQHYPCRAGLTACSRPNDWPARVLCQGEVVPIHETCDGLDNDCNGVVDDVPGVESSPVDVVVIVDRSGSMDPYQSAIQSALRVLLGSNLDLAIWLWDVPGTGLNESAPNQICYGASPTYPLASCVEPSLSLAINGLYSGFGGAEPTYDALFDVIHPSLNKIAWRPGSVRFVILLGDEIAQTNRGLMPQDLINLISSLIVPIYVTVFTQSQFITNYNSFAVVELLSSNLIALENNIVASVKQICE